MAKPNVEHLGLSKDDLKKQNEIIERQKKLDEMAKKREAVYQDMLAKRAANDMKGAQESEEAWKVLRDNYKKELKETVAGYDTLVAVLNKMMIGLGNISHAMRKTFPITYLLRPLTLVADQAGCATRVMRDKVKMMNYADETSLNIPHIQYSVDLNDNNCLSLDALAENLKRSDGEKFTLQQKTEFEWTIKNWLEQTRNKKYDLINVDGRTLQIVDDVSQPGTRLVLDQKQFKELRDDPVDGLQAYLQKNFQFKINPSPEEPTPSSPAP